MNRRRSLFLSLVAFVYALSMGGWWLSSRAKPPLPQVRLRIETFTGTSPDAEQFSVRLTQELKEVVAPASADVVLSGKLAGGPGNVSVTARLRDFRTGEQFWSGDYQASPSEPRAIPSDVARDVIGALRYRAAHWRKTSGSQP
jgi:hypothetical protein